MGVSIANMPLVVAICCTRWPVVAVLGVGRCRKCGRRPTVLRAVWHEEDNRGTKREES